MVHSFNVWARETSKLSKQYDINILYYHSQKTSQKSNFLNYFNFFSHKNRIFLIILIFLSTLHRRWWCAELPIIAKYAISAEAE